MNYRLSSETVHATCVAKDGRAVLLMGPSGAGKSDLALRLIDRGYTLVSDDQTILRAERGRLIASAPSTIAGKMEVRGIGIVEIEALAEAPVALVVELGRETERLPEAGRHRRFLDIEIPSVSLDAMTASATVKLDLALRLSGATVSIA